MLGRIIIPYDIGGQSDYFLCPSNISLYNLSDTPFTIYLSERLFVDLIVNKNPFDKQPLGILSSFKLSIQHR
ncbi:hypothetical protein [Clostridium pasteurianum]|uniref:hypothetical protein n=1 Tax=Clostridium pasteurianum TaxID=1501 RepID=UPI0012BD7A35|nr:hypothetical protein [Clostridium pasteurianum]